MQDDLTGIRPCVASDRPLGQRNIVDGEGFGKVRQAKGASLCKAFRRQRLCPKRRPRPCSRRSKRHCLRLYIRRLSKSGAMLILWLLLDHCIADLLQLCRPLKLMRWATLCLSETRDICGWRILTACDRMDPYTMPPRVRSDGQGLGLVLAGQRLREGECWT